MGPQASCIERFRGRTASESDDQIGDHRAMSIGREGRMSSSTIEVVGSFQRVAVDGLRASFSTLAGRWV